jgi:rubrerythrin
MYLSLAVVLEIALGMERKGIEVYERMKERAGGGAVLDYLIEQEHNHIRVFRELFARGKSGTAEETMETPHLDEDYLAAAYANTEVFARVHAPDATPHGLYELALAAEKESIRFYLELAEEMPERFARQRDLLRTIADEERGHLRTLLVQKDALIGGR